MVLLVQKLAFSLKLSSKLENHHHPSEAFNASLQAFHSSVSNCISKLSLNLKPGTEFLSLIWLQQCFELLPTVNKAFAKLVVEIDYPMSKWEVSSVEEYLNYSLNLLELLNSISSSISHLNLARVSLSHALSLIENSPEKLKRLKEINSKDFSNDFKVEGIGERKERLSTGKDLVLHQALLIMKNIGLWVCGVVISGLCSDVKPYTELRKLGGEFVLSPVMALDSSVRKEMMGKRGIAKELREVNDAVGCLVSDIVNGKTADSAKELQRRLEVLEKVLKGIGEEANLLFSEVLAGRNELLDILRQQNQ